MSKNVKTMEDVKRGVVNTKPVSIYLAGPFFNEKQRKCIKELETLLEARGYDVYSPSRDGIMLTPDASKRDRLRVFEENVTNCTGKDLVLAVIDDRDQGTMIEMGMCYGHWFAKQNKWTENDVTSETEVPKVPRMISFSNDGWDINIMLLGAVLKHCKGYEELSAYLDVMDEVGLDNLEVDESVYSERCF